MSMDFVAVERGCAIPRPKPLFADEVP
jgi:hypothetical protein